MLCFSLLKRYHYHFIILLPFSIRQFTAGQRPYPRRSIFNSHPRAPSYSVPTTRIITVTVKLSKSPLKFRVLRYVRPSPPFQLTDQLNYFGNLDFLTNNSVFNPIPIKLSQVYLISLRTDLKPNLIAALYSHTQKSLNLNSVKSEMIFLLIT